MDPTSDVEPDSIGIAVPRQWTSLPVEHAEFDRFCATLREGWVEAGWDRTLQRRADLLLHRLRRDIRRAGAQFAALYVGEPTEEDAANALPVEGEDPAAQDVLLAAVTVGTYDRAALGTTGRLSLGNLVMAFGRKPRSEPHAADQRYKSITNLEPAILHELPIGRSIRLRRLYELHGSGMLPERFYGESYITPLGTRGEKVTITHFVTPNLRMAQPFSALFAAIAKTLTAWRPDEDTSFESEWVDTYR